jgi:phage head maturation protease
MKTKTATKLYAEITKVDAALRLVSGYASTEALDSQNEIIRIEAISGALDDYMKFANIREMHQPSAVGIAEEASIDSKGLYLSVKVVDDNAWAKVVGKVYKGFSIGGRVTKRDPDDDSIITGLRLSEISLVDRPANPEALFEVFKMADDEDEASEQTAELDAPAVVVGENEEPAPLEFAKGVVVDEAETLTAVDELAAILDKGDITPARMVEIARLDIANKGMYNVQRMSELLQAVDYLAQDTAWEAEYEQDGSQVPAKLREWLLTGVAIFHELVAEETAELVADGADAADDGGVVELAEVATDVNKAAFDTMLAKFAATQVTPKAQAVIKSVGIVEGELYVDVVNKMADRIVTLEAMPTIGKAFVSALAVSKAEDIGGLFGAQEDKIEPVKKSDGTVDDLATQIKAIHSGLAS